MSLAGARDLGCALTAAKRLDIGGGQGISMVVERLEWRGQVEGPGVLLTTKDTKAHEGLREVRLENSLRDALP